jgi:rhamnosyltransferase subunit B
MDTVAPECDGLLEDLVDGFPGPSRHIVLMPFGSAGDVFPFLWLGKLLKARGHRVTMISACLFAKAAELAGIDFFPLGTEEEFEAIAKDKRIWKPVVGSRLVLDHAVEYSAKYLAAVEAIGDVDLLLAPLTAFGARMAREKHGIPLITVHLQPMVFMSAYETPLLHPCIKWFRGLPLWLKKFLFSLPNGIDLMALPKLRKICHASGVNPPRSIWREWWHSPDGVLVLFPDWFGKPQPDWPENLLQWDFPMEDLTTEIEMQTELKDFFAAGDRPVIFTPGSANVQAERFFATAAEAVKRLGIRAVFVTRMENRVPLGMEDRIIQVDFVPFSKVLAHASAFVHHGGVGTMAQGFRAGVPQLVMAMSHDQPDNADRLEKLGAGIFFMASAFTPDRVTKQLARLLEDTSFREAAEALKRKADVAREHLELMRWMEGRAVSG